jgi:hypothetical protein
VSSKCPDEAPPRFTVTGPRLLQVVMLLMAGSKHRVTDGAGGGDAVVRREEGAGRMVVVGGGVETLDVTAVAVTGLAGRMLAVGDGTIIGAVKLRAEKVSKGSEEDAPAEDAVFGAERLKPAEAIATEESDAGKVSVRIAVTVAVTMLMLLTISEMISTVVTCGWAKTPKKVRRRTRMV